MWATKKFLGPVSHTINFSRRHIGPIELGDFWGPAPQRIANEPSNAIDVVHGVVADAVVVDASGGWSPWPNASRIAT